MDILVCLKRVPDTSENEIELNRAGNDIERDDLVYSVNEPDNYAVEEALQIAGRTGGALPLQPLAAKTTRRFSAGNWPWAHTTQYCFPTRPLMAWTDAESHLS